MFTTEPGPILAPKKMDTKKMVTMAMLVAMLAVASQIAIPVFFSPIPFTLQTLAVLLIGLLLSPPYACGTIFVYVLAGAIGLPVFAQAKSGFGALLGPTGGFIWGFILAVLLISLLLNHKELNWKRAIFAVLVGLLVLYTCGVIQLSLIANLSLGQAFLAGALPYLPFEVVKALLAIKIALTGFKGRFQKF